jgi:hypothetical protein
VVVADNAPHETSGFRRLDAKEVSTFDGAIMADDHAKLIHHRCTQGLDLRFSVEFQSEIVYSIGGRTMGEIVRTLNRIRDLDEEDARDVLQDVDLVDTADVSELYVKAVERTMQNCSEDDRPVVRLILIWALLMDRENPELETVAAILATTKWDARYLEQQISSGMLAE